MADLLNLTQQEVCRLLKISRMTCNRWRKEGLPRQENGLYNGPEVVAWMLGRIEDKAAEGRPVENSESLRWLAEFRKERALISQIERLKLQKQLISEAAVIEEWRTRVSIVVKGLEALADRLPGALVGMTDRNVMHKIVSRETNDLRKAYIRAGEYCPQIDRMLNVRLDYPNTEGGTDGLEAAKA
jgi:hypothetical protein